MLISPQQHHLAGFCAEEKQILKNFLKVTKTNKKQQKQNKPKTTTAKTNKTKKRKKLQNKHPTRKSSLRLYHFSDPEVGSHHIPTK